MQRSDAFDAAGFDAAIDEVRRGARLSGTRMMLTASFLGIDGIVAESTA
jgi:hypothetical protein